MKTLYLHGLPGSKAELGLTRLPHLTCVDRSAPSFAQMANALPPGEMHLVGFSLGAAAALRLAALLPERVVRVTLISPIVPPALGGALPGFVTGGGLLARLAPGMVTGGLIKKITAAEPGVFSDPTSLAALKTAFKDATGPGAAAMARELEEWKKPWENFLPQVRCQVSIWRGEADPFTTAKPISAMARELSYAEANWLPRTGHYGALVTTLEALSKHPDLR